MVRGPAGQLAECRAIIIIIIININKVTIISEMMKSETATRILQLARRYVYATGDVVRKAAQQQQQQPGVTIDRAAGRPAQLHIGKQVGERAITGVIVVVAAFVASVAAAAAVQRAPAPRSLISTLTSGTGTLAGA